MKWILIAAAALAGFVALMAIIGAMLPKAHTASRSAIINGHPEALWQAITDCAAFPEWRSDVKNVEILPERAGRKTWREDGKNGKITFETIDASPPSRLVVKIADPDLPFGGTWTYELAQSGSGCRVTITEEGEVYNPIFRFMGRVFFSPTASIETYLRSLGKKFGEDVKLLETS